jgi:glutathione synthase/RimK-type ligase-like ATP-grasp enzyme
MDLKVAGVDIIRSSKGPLLLEVNSPGLEGRCDEQRYCWRNDQSN